MLGTILGTSLITNVIQGFHAACNSKRAREHTEKLQAIQQAQAAKQWQKSAQLQRELQQLTLEANKANLEKQLVSQRKIFEDQARLATWPLNNAAPATAAAEFENKLRNAETPKFQIFVIHDGSIKKQKDLNAAIESAEREIEDLFTESPKPCVHTTNILKDPMAAFGSAAVELVYGVYKLAPCLLILMSWTDNKLRIDYYIWDSLGEKEKFTVNWDVLAFQKIKLREGIEKEKLRRAFGEEIVDEIREAIDIEEDFRKEAKGDSEVMAIHQAEIDAAYTKVFKLSKVSRYLDRAIREELREILNIPALLITDAYYLSSLSALPKFPGKTFKAAISNETIDKMFSIDEAERPLSHQLKSCSLLAKSFMVNEQLEKEAYYMNRAEQIVADMELSGSMEDNAWLEDKDICEAMRVLADIDPEKYASLSEKTLAAQTHSSSSPERELELDISLQPRMKCEVYHNRPQKLSHASPAICIKNLSQKQFAGLRVSIINGDTGSVLCEETMAMNASKEKDITLTESYPRSFVVKINHSSGIKQKNYLDGWQEIAYPPIPQIGISWLRSAWSFKINNRKVCPVLKNFGSSDLMICMGKANGALFNRGKQYTLKPGVKKELGFTDWSDERLLTRGEHFWIKVNGCIVNCIIS